MAFPSGSIRAVQRPEAPPALVGAMVAMAILIIDQSTKVIVRSVLPPCSPEGCVGLHAGPLAIINETNTGGAFSLRPGSALWVVLAMGSVVMAAAFVPRLKKAGAQSWTTPLALGLLAGGALGNLTDRLVNGGVTDFIVPGAYFTFNLADVAAVIGTLMTIGILIRNRARLAHSRGPRTA